VGAQPARSHTLGFRAEKYASSGSQQGFLDLRTGAQGRVCCKAPGLSHFPSSKRLEHFSLKSMISRQTNSFVGENRHPLFGIML
jgi:hypothetical protein